MKLIYRTIVRLKFADCGRGTRRCEEIMVSNKAIIEVLMETSQLLQRKGWNKFSMARDDRGAGCGLDSNQASCYCLSGALVKAWRTLDPDNEEFYFKFFEKKFSEILRDAYGYNRTYTQWNDNVATSREDVVKLIHSVITSLLAEGVDAHSGAYQPSAPSRLYVVASQEKLRA
jgi:hypothetical protein